MIQHAPQDVDRYIYDYERVIELADEGKSTSQIAFVTGLRPHVVREHTNLYKELGALGRLSSADETTSNSEGHPHEVDKPGIEVQSPPNHDNLTI
jgi:hypothetical protein